MKLSRLSLSKEKKGEIEMPSQFNEQIRPDLIKRAVFTLQSRSRQPSGSKHGAGMRAQAKLSRRRRDYKTSYGHGISRVPRKVLSHRGARFNWVGAVSPGTVKGRRAHPPKAEKIWEEKINKKENRKAIRSAMSATVIKEIVEKRGHKVPADYPFIIEGEIENLSKAKDVYDLLLKLGFEDELNRTRKSKIRAGKGKSRGRPYKSKKGLLIVVSDNCKLLNAAASIPGVNTAKVSELNADMLAPGALPGRATIWSEKAIEKIAKTWS